MKGGIGNRNQELGIKNQAVTETWCHGVAFKPLRPPDS